MIAAQWHFNTRNLRNFKITKRSIVNSRMLISMVI